MKQIVLLEVGPEIHEFLEVAMQPELPAFDLAAILDQVLHAICNSLDQKDDHNSLALTAGELAYGEGMFEGPHEGCGLPLHTKIALFEAVMRLGWKLRQHLLSLYLVSNSGKTFAHRFREIERDHLLFLEVDFVGGY